MNLRAVDLNLLTIFDAIFKARSLTRAAEKIGMSQPAMSHALSRLRHLFDDQLFLRDGRGVMPTQRADALAVKVDQILRRVDDALAKTRTFDPTKSTREFNLMLTDYGEMVLLPALMEKLEKLAATVRINACPHHHADVREALKFGKVDFYLWTTPIGERGFSSHLVATEELWCMVRKDSKLKKLTLEQYLTLPQIVMDWPTWQGRRPIEHYLDNRGLTRNQTLSVHTFFDMPSVVARTGLVSTMPSRMAKTFAAVHGLQCFKAPLPGLSLPIYLIWHSRLDHDPAHRWMRELLVELCQVA